MNSQAERMIRDFFAYAVEREWIRIRREGGQPGPFTDDFILQQFRFCNVFREDDTVTRWLKDNVRRKVSPDQELIATVLFRWFNRISTGEVIFRQTNMFANGATAYETFINHTRDTDVLRAAIKAYIPKGPWVTGSYIIKGYDGMNKLDGVLKAFGEFTRGEQVPPDYDNPVGWEQMTETLLADPGATSLEEVWGWLKKFAYLGPFLAYEVVCDLYQGPLLRSAPDIMTWANPGPGARRGLNRIYGRGLEEATPRAQLIAEMRGLLSYASDTKLWPWEREWDMRTVEHTLCEFDKYQRVLNGQGRPRQVFRGG